MIFVRAARQANSETYVERFDRMVRHEWLIVHDFESVEQAPWQSTKLLWAHNNERLKTTIGRIPPWRLVDMAA